jgi:hypothetical protein
MSAPFATIKATTDRLTKADRAMWLDRAWKRASPPGQYTLDSMPSAAEAWEEFKRDRRAQEVDTATA